MTVLERVTELKNQGIADDAIISTLQQEGISPKEINDALGQLQIKSAVSGAPPPQYQNQQPQTNIAPQTPEIPELPPPQQDYSQEPSNYEEYDQFPGGYAQGNYYQQEAYPDYGAAPASTSTDTMIEISEQVFAEKLKPLQKQIESINEIKTLSQVKIENIEQRLKRIETMFDKMQIEILNKIGSYGGGLESTKKELAMVQDSFRKALGRGAIKKSASKSAETKPKSKKKSSKKK